MNLVSSILKALIVLQAENPAIADEIQEVVCGFEKSLLQCLLNSQNHLVEPYGRVSQDHFGYNILHIRFECQPLAAEICLLKITSETNDKDDFYYRCFHRHRKGYGQIVCGQRLEGDRDYAQA
jgi:hypothetical protein